jgi:hypothetical protein
MTAGQLLWSRYDQNFEIKISEATNVFAFIAYSWLDRQIMSYWFLLQGITKLQVFLCASIVCSFKLIACACFIVLSVSRWLIIWWNWAEMWYVCCRLTLWLHSVKQEADGVPVCAGECWVACITLRLELENVELVDNLSRFLDESHACGVRSLIIGCQLRNTDTYRGFWIIVSKRWCNVCQCNRRDP